jgi:hypothetical protein
VSRDAALVAGCSGTITGVNDDMSATFEFHWKAGNASYERGDLNAARNHYQQALAIRPDSVPARHNLGVVYRDLELWELALIEFVDVIARNGRSAGGFHSLALVETHLGLYQAAVTHFRRAIALKDPFPDAHFNLGMLLLRLGNFPEGFLEYEWRWQTDQFTPFRSPNRKWRGRPIAGTLLVHTEQGAGDAIQFARFLPMAAERCGRLLLVSPANLFPLFSTLPGISKVRGAGKIDASEFEAYLPLLSLPGVLGTTLETVPRHVPYLMPEARDVALGPSPIPDAKRKVGLVWAGSPTHRNDRHRSCRLREFRPLFDVPGVAFYGLQMGPQASEIAELRDSFTNLSDLRLNERKTDYADTAALLGQLDLLISIDTSVLHLAGALGRPAWGLISAISDWRWMVDREDSPWYPTLRLFRQARLDDWSELLQRVAAALRQWLESEPPSTSPTSGR